MFTEKCFIKKNPQMFQTVHILGNLLMILAHSIRVFRVIFLYFQVGIAAAIPT